MRLIAAVLLVVGALAALGFARHEDRLREQARLAVIAGDIAGRKVSVRCPGFLASLVNTREGGRVRFDAEGRPADYTDLSPETCRELRRLGRIDFSCIERDACGYREFRAAWAAHTLAHEAFHLRGFPDEARTECYSLQNTAFVAQRLGVPADTARRLQAWLFEDAYPNMPDEYRTAECYDGGPLDLRPDLTVFP